MAADLTMIFSALADPTRRAILARLSQGDAPVKDLVGPFALSGPAITKHLKVLEQAGLISRSREGQQRPCRLEAQALAPAAEWIDQYRAMWEERFDRLDAFLKTVAQQTAAAPAGSRRRANAKGASTKKPKAKRQIVQRAIARKTKSKGPQGGRHGRRK